MKTSSPIASPAGTTATRPVCRRLGFELRDPGWRPSPKARGDWPLAQVILSFVFGVLLLAATLAVEVSTGMCAETFFDPLPSVRHALLVIDPLPVRVDCPIAAVGMFFGDKTVGTPGSLRVDSRRSGPVVDGRFRLVLGGGPEPEPRAVVGGHGRRSGSLA